MTVDRENVMQAPSNTMGLEVVARVLDASDRELHRQSQPGRSLLEQYVRFLRSFMAGENGLFAVDITSTSLNITGNSIQSLLLPTAAEAQTDRGIVVGTGTTAVAIADRALETIIAEGAGAGQLRYQPLTVGPYDLTDPVASFLISRYFQNVSGGTVQVSETGIYARINTFPGGLLPFCIARDALSPAVDVPNETSLAIDYKVKIEVS